MKTIYLAMLFLLTVVPVPAQDTDVSTSSADMAYVFAQYHPSDLTPEAEKQSVESFVTQIKNISKYAEGRIFIYRGRTDYKFDAGRQTESIEKTLYLLEKNGMGSHKVFVRFGGFREESEIEMVIAPSYKATLTATPTVSLLDVKFYDDGALPKATIQKSGNELLKELIKQVEPAYPAAARAVRATGEVGVLVTVDENGGLTAAKAIIGHPLLRAACITAMRQWQFKPQKFNDAPTKVISIMNCEFVIE